jgi:large subunit ribosomal protein L2
MLIQRKATTSGRRHQIVVDRSNLHKGGPEKSLLAPGHKKRQGRNSTGKITVRHRGGGVKKRMRVIEWRRHQFDIPAKVVRFEYDPMRSANLALLQYENGVKSYILAPMGLEIGDTVLSGEKVEPTMGNAVPLKNAPIGSFVHCIEMKPGKGAQMARGAGTGAIVQAREAGMVTLQLPSKELRLVKEDCFATIGQVGNQDWKNRKLGKAGRKRLLGIRPTVRGTAQHPDSHPHGGGEGRSGVGMKYPKTPWGKHALGKKTRAKRHYSNKYILRDRRAKA